MIRRPGHFILGTVFVLGVASMAGAQGTMTDEPGFQENRNYLALLPWESIDTGSNNVILTFSDLVLPGNAGRELRFLRVFSNLGPPPPESGGPAWRFGIAGVPMRVVYRPLPQAPILPAGNIAAEQNTTPYFLMLDGSIQKTTYTQVPDINNNSTLLVVRTPNFWVYDRSTWILRMPDGLFAQYCPLGGVFNDVPCLEGYLIGLWDAFGNQVTLTWTKNSETEEMALHVEQSVGNGQPREIHFVMNYDTELPESMEYDNKTWTYTYNGAQLVEARPPGKNPGTETWRYEYSTEQFEAGFVTRVTTPQGGTVDYDYDDFLFYESATGNQRPDRALSARHTNDQVGHEGTWTFDHFGQSAQDHTEVTLPSGAKVIYVYGGSWNPNVLAGGWQLRFRYVQDEAGGTVETEERQYETGLKAARSQEEWYVPEIERRLITRSGQTYTTDFDYGALGTNFHNYHHPQTITERGPTGTVERTTALTYEHLLTPSRLALPKQESVTIQGMTAVKSWTYNATTGFRTSETLYGITMDFTPDSFGNVENAERENGTSTSYTYSRGVLEDTITPGVFVDRSINEDGTIASETVAGRMTTYHYGENDPLGRLTRTVPPGPVNPILTSYNDANRTVTTTRGSSSVIVTMDGFGRTIRSVDANNVTIRTEYDAEGRRIYQSHPFDTTDVGTGFTYDALGRVTAEVNEPSLTSRTRTYDDTTNSVTLRDENLQATVLTYRAFGHPDDHRLVTVVDADQLEWTYSYDAIGNLTQVVTPTGHTRTWVRNTSGLVTSETHPESGTVLYTEYSPTGVLKRMTDAKGTQFIFHYDDNLRVWRIQAGTKTTDIVYEPGSDNRVWVSDGSVSTTFEYDAAGRLKQRWDVVGGFAFDSAYDYNGNDQLTKITYPSGRTIEYERNNPEGLITKVFETQAGRDYAFGMTYHPSGALKTYTAGNNIPTTVTFSPDRYWVESITAGPLGLNYSDFDGVGNVGTITDSRGSAWDQALTYDALNRLAFASGAYGAGTATYDPHGNRQFGGTYVYDPTTLRLTNQGGAAFGYDNNGNMTSAPGKTFTYTPENQLATVNSSEATYLYDADGWRVRRGVPGDTTFYVRGPGGELLTEYHQAGGNTRVRDYVYADTRLISAVDRPMPAPGCGSGPSPDGSPNVMTIASGGTGSFTFEGTACRKVSVVITSGTLTPNCLGTIFLKKPDMTTLAQTGGACGGTILEPVVLPVSGTYTVIVDPYQTNAGTITVSAYDIVDVTGPMLLGQPMNALLHTPGQRGVWTFTGSANQRLSAVITAADMTNCLGTLTILKPDLTQLAQGGGAGCEGMMIDPVVVLPTNGTYTVIVDPYKTSVGEISVTAFDVVDQAGPITVNGAPVYGTLTTPGQNGVWSFAGTSGQVVRGIVDATTIEVCSLGAHKFRIHKPDGTQLISKNGICAGSTVGPVTLPVTGTYTVVVDPSTSYTGLVNVRVVSP